MGAVNGSGDVSPDSSASISGDQAAYGGAPQNPPLSARPVDGDATGTDSSTPTAKEDSKPSVSRGDLPPFLRGVPVDAQLRSLRVGETLKFPQVLVSPSGAAAVSLAADGSVLTSRTVASPMPDAFETFELLRSNYRDAFSAIRSREERRWAGELMLSLIHI